MTHSSTIIKQGFRSSTLRNALIEVFEKTAMPLTVPAIQKYLSQRNIIPNKTSLYRQIDSLLKSDILQKVSLKNDITHYEKTKNHHHHFVCETCESIQCIDDPSLENAIHQFESNLKQKGLKTKTHQLSFIGTCKQCL